MTWLFGRIRETLRAALDARAEIGATGKQELVLIPGMTAAPEPCQLAVHYNPGRHPKKAIAQLKHDGIRAICPPGRIVTREAQPFNAALHCRPVLDELEEIMGQPMVFDAEYAELEGFNATLAAFKKGEGAGVLFLFDAVPYAEWKKNRFTETLEFRLQRLERAMSELVNRHPVHFLSMVRHTEVDREIVPEMAKQLFEAGWEGMVIKDAKGFYHRGRSSDWQKVKKRETHDGTIIDVLFKNGEPSGFLVRDMLDRTHKVASNVDKTLLVRARLDPQRLVGEVLEFGATDKNDAGKLTGIYFIRMRPDR